MDSPRPAYRLQPNVRVAAAGGILFVGILTALLFRAEMPRVAVPEAEDSGVAVSRETSSESAGATAGDADATVPSDGRPRLTGTIETASTDAVAPASDAAAPNDSTSTAPADPGSQPPWRTSAEGASPPASDVGLVPRDPLGTVYGTRVADEAGRTHRIADGDTLFYLAELYLGDGERYLEIYEANRDVLSDPDLLVIGAVVRIPPADAPRPRTADEELAAASAGGGLTPVPPGATGNTSHTPAPPAALEPPARLDPPAVVDRPATTGTPASVTIDPTSHARPKTYRVRAGDTLVEIARQVYGDARRYLEIYEANRDRLRGPQNLREGLILNIP